MKTRKNLSKIRGEPAVHKCALCPYSTRILGTYKDHLRTHSDVKPFGCPEPECPFKTKWESSLKYRLKTLHLLGSGPSEPFPCSHPGCNFATKNKSTLKGHSKVHCAQKSLFCSEPNCNFATNHKGSLLGHTQSHMGEKLYVCQFQSCSYAAVTSSQLLVHSRTHTKEKPYKCPEIGCEYSGAHSSVLKRHRLTHEPNPGEGAQRPLFLCPVEGCTYSTKRKDTVTTHLKVHSDSFLQCALCPFQTRWKYGLQKHIDNMHDPNPDLDLHLDPEGESSIRIRNLRPFKCQELDCAYESKYKSHLHRHILTHGTEKKYSCSFPNCHYTAVLQRNLDSHQVRHEAEKRFKCGLCDFAAKMRKTLIVHMRRHTKEEPFNCKEKDCDYRAKQFGHLRQHEKKCHPHIFKPTPMPTK